MPDSSKSKNKFIQIKKAKVHNLKNISINIPRDKFILITGLSGSGKSSLAFDTLYAEGQRRYIESLSSYARQFLGKINKPEVDLIKGIPPAIAIEQKVNNRNPRSTVGTSTEIYDYLKLFYARIGKTYSPVSGQIVKQHNVKDVIDFISKFDDEIKVLILSPVIIKSDISIKEYLKILTKQGYTRIEIGNNIDKIDNIINYSEKHLKSNTINIIIDRLVINKKEDNINSIADSVQTAFDEGHGTCIIKIINDEEVITQSFSNKFEADGMSFEEPSVNTFSFNNPVGACPTCQGFGQVVGIDENLIIPDKNLSVYEDAIACWKGEKMSEWKEKLIYNADKFDFPIHRPYNQLTDAQKKLLWTGNKYFSGLNSFFKFLEENQYKIQYAIMLSRYKGKTICPDCNGTRLKKEATYIKINNKSINELVSLSVINLMDHINNLSLNEYETKVAYRILLEIKNRLNYLINVGLGYLTLNRLSSSLSGGESQRINLSTSIGSNLVGSLYILDEPSIGLHSRDTNLLIKVLKDLQRIGNTVIVVEHDEEIIKAADQIIDIGPLAGRNGGEVVFQGTFSELMLNNESITAKYLSDKESIKVPKLRRKWNNYIEIIGARENNLKNINVKFPLNVLTVITGVSGSGKSSLLKSIFYPALKKMYGGYGERVGQFSKVIGDTHLISEIEFVDQYPIGKSSRSNPVTYIKAFDDIRTLFANQKSAKYNGLKPSHFSFNVDGGRCDECQGDGNIKVEMQFMADIELICESCEGKRFKNEVLEIEYNGLNIFDVLELTISEAVEFFSKTKSTLENRIVQKLTYLQDVGLDYVKLGQPSNTLSGGESQRVKLATFLSKEKTNNTIFIFDEPTIGLHFHDINKLLSSFNSLISRGHTIIIIEHNLEVIKCADWIIDLGPEGGDNGGNIVFEGTPEEIISCNSSYTGKYLSEKINAKNPLVYKD